jgi:hypothetical protein
VPGIPGAVPTRSSHRGSRSPFRRENGRGEAKTATRRPRVTIAGRIAAGRGLDGDDEPLAPTQENLELLAMQKRSESLVMRSTNLPESI